MTITKRQEDATIILDIEGRVDTNTSPELQAKILESFQSAKKLILNFEKVPYISSAGLRALLIGQKTSTSKNATMEMINVSEMVMSVLDSVGFSQILTIK